MGFDASTTNATCTRRLRTGEARKNADKFIVLVKGYIKVVLERVKQRKELICEMPGRLYRAPFASIARAKLKSRPIFHPFRAIPIRAKQANG